MIKFNALAVLFISAIGVRWAVATPFDPLSVTPARYNAFFLGAARTPYIYNIQGSVAVQPSIFLSSQPLETADAAPVIQDGMTVSGFLGTSAGAMALSAAHYDAAGLSGVALSGVSDASYWGHTRIGNGLPSLSPPLDIFGSPTDVANAVTTLESDAPPNRASVANGILTVNLTRNGLNNVFAAIPSGAAITGMNIAAAAGIWPTGLVLTIADDTLAYDGAAFALKPLDSRQTLIRFDNGAAISLSAISLRNLPSPPSISIDFTRVRLPVAYSILANAPAQKPVAVPASPQPVTQPAPPLPQSNYLAIIESARNRYTAARSIDGRRDARLSMQIDIHNFMGLSHAAQSWTGIYKGSKRQDDGSRSVEIEIAPSISIATWENRFFDGQTSSLVRPGSIIARLLDTLTIGEPVIFSAELIGSVVSNDDDMIRRPRVIANFTMLKKAL